MPDGAGIAAASMRAQAAQLEVVSANLVNTSTPGYKRQVSDASYSFANLLNTNVPVAAPAAGIDLRPGPLRNTGNTLDLAIEGDAFFELQSGTQSVYTRQGNFVLDAQGRLQASDGALVQGVSGEIKLETTQPRIDAQGRVFEGDTQVGQLKLARFDQPSRLRPLDNARFQQGDAQVAPSGVDGGQASVRQGFLESSNVVPAEEMLKLMQAVRQFDGSQRVILWFGDMHDQVQQRLGQF